MDRNAANNASPPVTAATYTFRTPGPAAVTPSILLPTASLGSSAPHTAAAPQLPEQSSGKDLSLSLEQLAARRAALNSQLDVVQRAKEARLANVRSLDMSRQRSLTAETGDSGVPAPLLQTPSRSEVLQAEYLASRRLGSATRPVDPLARSADLLRKTESVFQEAEAVESVRSALLERVDLEGTDVFKLRNQLDRASDELQLAHKELSNRQSEVAQLRAQLDNMVNVASQLLANVDSETAGALTVAVTSMHSKSATVGAPAPTPMRLHDLLEKSVPPDVRALASKPLSAYTPQQAPSTHTSHGTTTATTATTATGENTFDSVLAKFDEWARHHDAAVAMLQALPAKSV